MIRAWGRPSPVSGPARRSVQADFRRFRLRCCQVFAYLEWHGSTFHARTAGAVSADRRQSRDRPRTVVTNVMARYLDEQARFLAAVEKGIAAAERVTLSKRKRWAPGLKRCSKPDANSLDYIPAADDPASIKKLSPTKLPAFCRADPANYLPSYPFAQNSAAQGQPGHRHGTRELPLTPLPYVVVYSVKHEAVENPAHPSWGARLGGRIAVIFHGSARFVEACEKKPYRGPSAESDSFHFSPAFTPRELHPDTQLQSAAATHEEPPRPRARHS